MILGKLQVIVDADSTRLHRGLDGVDSRLAKTRLSVDRLGKAFIKFGAVGAAAAAAVGVAVVRSQLNQIDILAKTSAKLNIAIQDLQGLRFAAEQTGVSTQILDTALQRMTRRIAEASGGTGVAVKALKELGLSAQDLVRMSPDEAFAKLATAMDGVANQGDRVRLAMALFDTEGVALVNTMRGGEAAINAFKQEAMDLGLTLDNVDAAKVEAANDALSRVSKLIQGQLQTATIELAPYIEALATNFSNASKEAGGFGKTTVNAMQAATTAFAKVADVIHIFKLGFKTLELAGFALGNALMSNFKTVSEVMQELLNVPIALANSVIYSINKIPGFDDIEPIPAKTLAAVDFFNEAVTVAEQKVRETKNELLALSAQGFPSENVTKLFNDIRDSAQEAAEKAQSVMSKNPQLSIDANVNQTQDTNITDSELDNFEAFSDMLDKQIEAERVAEEAKLANKAIANQLFIEQLNARNQTELEAIESKRLAELDMLKTFNDEELALLGGFEAAKNQIEEDAAKKREEIAENERKQKLAVASSMFGNLSSLMNTGSKKMFEIGKASAKAGAIVDGIAAVQGAYKVGAKIGGPLLGAAYAATSAVATAAQVRQINAQQFGSAGSPVSFSGGIPSVNTNQGGGFNQQATSPQRNVSINLQGSLFSADQVRSLIGQINEQIGDGVVIAGR